MTLRQRPGGRPISVVVPVYNEHATLAELYRRLAETADEHRYSLQVVFVDDGSTDGSWQVIKGLVERHAGTVEGVRFRRNFGKADALSAGFSAATAPVIVTIDADLQDDPHELPNLIAKLDGGPEGAFDVVSGWKVDRQDPWHKRWPSLVFNALVSRLTGVRLHDHNCGLKAYRREALEEVRLYGELHRFIPVLAAARGYRATEAPVRHFPREHGVSKYGVSRIVKGLLDLITVKFLTGYGERPQHVLGGLGLLGFALGAGGLVYLAVRWVVSRAVPGLEPVHLHETAALFYSLALCTVGSQFLVVGLLGAMIASLQQRHAAGYSIAERAVATPPSGDPSPASGGAAASRNAS